MPPRTNTHPERAHVGLTIRPFPTAVAQRSISAALPHAAGPSRTPPPGARTETPLSSTRCRLCEPVGWITAPTVAGLESCARPVRSSAGAGPEGVGGNGRGKREEACT